MAYAIAFLRFLSEVYLPFVLNFKPKAVSAGSVDVFTPESNVAEELAKLQNKYTSIEIGSYPFFRQGKLGVSIVIRSKDKEKIDLCSSLILEFVKAKNIKVVELE